MPKKKSSEPNGPTVLELRAMQLRRPMVKLGRVAMWNALTKSVVDLKSSTLGLMQKFDPDTFNDLVKGERPVAMGDPKFVY